MRRMWKISPALQILYCMGCSVVLVCMSLYAAFYTTAFGEICFKMGEVMFLLSALNPIGIICAIGNLVSYLGRRKNSENKPPSGALVWVICGPILTTVFWCLSICAFVHYTGGV